MKFCILCTIVLYTSLLWVMCSGQSLTAEEFTWKLIENSLNYSKITENFVVAPFEAFQLYKDILNIADESQEDDAPPAIRKQRKTMNSKQTNETNLLSTVSLTARWSFNFQTRDTHKRVFHQLGRANQKIWVDFLRKDDTFYYSHYEQLNASIVQLPLNVKTITLTIILPDREDALPDLKEYLLDNMQEFADLINRTNKMVLVRLLLPKFHLAYKTDLTEFFEEISDKEVEKYDHVYQESKLEFNERGVGQFERTNVLFWNAYSYLRVSPEMFDISHPFLFLISDKNGMQFFGQVVKLQN